MVVNPSQDDAGNMVDYSQGVTSLTLYCDNNEPQIKSFEYTSTNPIDKNVFQKGDNIVVNYELEDISDKIMIVVDGEGVGSGKIVKKDMERIGSINIPIEKEGPYSVRIPITFYDAANNSVEESINIDVLSGVSNAQSNSYEGIWEIKSISIKPSKLSTKLLSTVGTYALITLKLKEKRKINNLVIIPSKTKSSCRILGSSGETVALCNLDLIGTDKDTLNLLIEFSQGEYGEGDKINATISFYTKSKDTVFYDTLNISKKIEYQNTKYLLTEETIVNLKQSLQNKSEDIQGKIEGIHKWYNVIEGIKLIACDTGQTLGTIGKLMRITQLTLSATGKSLEGTVIFSNIGSALDSAGKMVKKGGDTSDKTHDTLNKNLKIDTVCKVLSCNSDLNKWFISTEGGSFEKLGPLKQFFEETTEVDPYNSILEATVTVCPSAFLYHIENFYALQCNELLCSYSSLDLGVDISHCKTQYSRDLCYFVLKGVPNLISLVRVYDRVVEEVSSIMTSPAHAGGMALSFIFNHLCSADKEPISNAICKLPFYYKYLGDIKEVVKTWEYYKEKFNTDEEVNTGCRILTTIDEKYRENKKQLISRIDSPMWYSCVNGICYLKDSPVEIDNGKVYYHGESPFYAYDMNKGRWVVVTPSSKDEAKISYSTGDPGNDFLREFYDKYHEKIPTYIPILSIPGYESLTELEDKQIDNEVDHLATSLIDSPQYSTFLKNKDNIKEDLEDISRLIQSKRKLSSLELYNEKIYENLKGLINDRLLEEYHSSCGNINIPTEKCNKAKKKLIDEIEKQKEKIGEKIKKDINNALQSEQLKEYWSSDRATYDTYVHLVSFFQTVGRTMQLAGIHVDVTNFPVLSSFQSAGAFVRRLHTDEMVKAMCNRIGSHEEMEGMGTAEYSSPVLRKNILQIVAYRESYYNASSQKLENRYVVGYTLMNPKDKIMNYEIVIKNNKKEKILKEGSLESGKGTYEFLYYPRDVNSEYKEACVKVSNFLYFFEGYRLPGNDYICTKIKGGWSGNG